MYYYACIKLKVYSGLMVTASHNPKYDNGLKFAFDESGNCKGQEIIDFMNFIKRKNFTYGRGTLISYDITNDYLDLFKDNFSFGKRKLKVVVDPANGTTSIIVKNYIICFHLNLSILMTKVMVLSQIIILIHALKKT